MLFRLFEEYAQSREKHYDDQARKDAAIRSRIKEIKYAYEHPPNGSWFHLGAVGEKVKSVKLKIKKLKMKMTPAKRIDKDMVLTTLPLYNKEENDGIVKKIVEAWEDELAESRKVIELRVQYTNYVDPLRAEFYNADDLTLAARTGSVDLVIRILFHPFNPVVSTLYSSYAVVAFFCRNVTLLDHENHRKLLSAIYIITQCCFVCLSSFVHHRK